MTIRVPRDERGRKFSVELKSDLYKYRSDGFQYVSSGGSVVGVEPKNALMIFASPFLSPDMIPPMSAATTHTMIPGPINNGDWGTAKILHFPPGVYWMNMDQEGNANKLGQNHMRLDSNTNWVYFAPGAYVKGAIEYSTKDSFYATGHGVLSGEHYVYQANPSTYYQALKSDQYSLRMWWHNNLSGNQTWYCVGPTVANPPFNTMDFHGSESISVRIFDYNQVGAYFFQTDGPQMYPNSVVSDVFYHVNDDAIKMYYSNVTVSRIVVWKCHNDPIIQMGWVSRNITDVSIDDLSVIHTRYIKSETYVPSAIIGASPFYSGGVVDRSMAIRNVRISNVVCEGLGPALFRLSPLQNYENFVVTGISYVDGLQTNSIGTGESIIPAVTGIIMNLIISNWTVGDEYISISNDNWQSTSTGQFRIDSSYWSQWTIV